MKYIYIVVVYPVFNMPKVSNEAYDSLEKAQKFIEARSDNPIKLNEFKYMGRNQDYIIEALSIK